MSIQDINTLFMILLLEYYQNKKQHKYGLLNKLLKHIK